MTKQELIKAIIKRYEEVYHTTSQESIDYLQKYCMDLSQQTEVELAEELSFCCNELTNEDHIDDGLAFKFRS